MQEDVSDSSEDDIGASPHPQSQLSLRPLGSGSGLRSEYIDHYMRGSNISSVFVSVFETLSAFVFVPLYEPHLYEVLQLAIPRIRLQHAVI